MIYFAELTKSKLIKIGYTNNAERRMTALTREHGEPVTLLTTYEGEVPHEYQVHCLFGHLRVYSEVYRPEQELLDFMLNPFPQLAAIRIRIALRDMGSAFYRDGDGFKPFRLVMSNRPDYWVLHGSMIELSSTDDRTAKLYDIPIRPPSRQYQTVFGIESEECAADHERREDHWLRHRRTIATIDLRYNTDLVFGSPPL